MDIVKRYFWLYDNGVECKQRLDEFLLSWRYVLTHLSRAPQAILEIGVWEGGWLYLSAGFCEPGAKLIGIDTTMRCPHVHNQLKREGFDPALREGDSCKIRSQCTEIVDVLHIDGTHKAPQPQIDWRTWRNCLHTPGAVIFHDIKLGGVPKAFEEASREGTNAKVFLGSTDRKAIGSGVVLF